MNEQKETMYGSMLIALSIGWGLLALGFEALSPFSASLIMLTWSIYNWKKFG